MKKIVDFFYEIGKLKKTPRRGGILIGAKCPRTIGSHMFRLAIMAWVLGKERELDVNRAIKMSLIHDICEIYSGDITPYDYKNALPKDKRKWPALFDTWPRFLKKEKLKIYRSKYKKEKAGLLKLISNLPPNLRKEILDLWLDYEKGGTKEARFVKQVNRLETLLQALEYSEESKNRPFHSWWIGSEEHIDDPLLKEVMKELERRFYKKRKKRKTKKNK